MNVDRLVNSIGMGCVVFLIAAFILTMCAGCAGNHCRIDQRPPPDASFEDLEKMKREQCQ